MVDMLLFLYSFSLDSDHFTVRVFLELLKHVVSDLALDQMIEVRNYSDLLTLTVLVATIDAQWEGMGDVGSARYELALLPPCPTIGVLSYGN